MTVAVTVDVTDAVTVTETVAEAVGEGVIFCPDTLVSASPILPNSSKVTVDGIAAAPMAVSRLARTVAGSKVSAVVPGVIIESQSTNLKSSLLRLDAFEGSPTLDIKSS